MKKTFQNTIKKSWDLKDHLHPAAMATGAHESHPQGLVQGEDGQVRWREISYTRMEEKMRHGRRGRGQGQKEKMNLCTSS